MELAMKKNNIFKLCKIKFSSFKIYAAESCAGHSGKTEISPDDEFVCYGNILDFNIHKTLNAALGSAGVFTCNISFPDEFFRRKKDVFVINVSIHFLPLVMELILSGIWSISPAAEGEPQERYSVIQSS
jgi:hypothetical protein